MDKPRSRRASLRELSLGFVALAALVACSGGGDDDDDATAEHDGTGGTNAGSGGAHGGSSGNSSVDTGAPAFHVAIATADGSHAPKLCRGQCAQLTASADGGIAPYRYSFDHGIGDGAGPHEVCPTETTTYQVTVSDSSVEGEEFGGKNDDVTESITVTVGAACSDGGAVGGDAGADAGEPLHTGPPGTTLCNDRIAAVHDVADNNSVVDIWWDDFSAKVVVDADDNVVFAITYQGTLDLADGTSVSSPSAYSVLVGKLGSDCKPLWFRSIPGDVGALDPQVAVDSKGNIFVASRSLVPPDPNEFTDMFLLLSAFDANGKPLWNKSFDRAPGLHWQDALRVDADDNIVWLVAATSRTDFGGGPLGVGTSIDPTIEALVKFDGDGNHVWSKLVQESLQGNGQEGGTNVAMAVVNGTDIVFHGWSPEPRDWGAAGQTQSSQAGMAHAYLVRANRAGDYVSSETIDQTNTEQYRLSWIEVDSADHLLLSYIGANELALRDGAGNVTWSKQVIDRAEGFYEDWNKVLLDADDNVILGGSFRTNTSINGVKLVAPAQADMDAFVQKLSAAGDLLWTYQTSNTFGRDEWLLGVDTDHAGNVAALVGTLNDDSSRELHLLVLAP